MAAGAEGVPHSEAYPVSRLERSDKGKRSVGPAREQTQRVAICLSAPRIVRSITIRSGPAKVASSAEVISSPYAMDFGSRRPRLYSVCTGDARPSHRIWWANESDEGPRDPLGPGHRDLRLRVSASRGTSCTIPIATQRTSPDSCEVMPAELFRPTTSGLWKTRMPHWRKSVPAWKPGWYRPRGRRTSCRCSSRDTGYWTTTTDTSWLTIPTRKPPRHGDGVSRTARSARACEPTL
jgi:hypothetical protein